jgi:aminoglycoside phosphotransferase (APT) family kinase protein
VSHIDPLAIMRALGYEGSYVASVLAENRGKGVWRVSGEGAIFALRVLRPDEEDVAALERAAMETAGHAGVPAPAVVAAGTWERRPVMLLSFCEGRTLRQAMQARPWRAFGLGMACGRAQAMLHERSRPASLPAPPWVERFGPVDPELRARLEAVARPDPSLLHLDFHPDNVLVDGAGAITGVVDWTNACAGDPRADLARSWSLLTRRTRSGARARVVAVAWKLAAAGWHRGYEQVAGPQSNMELFRLWAANGLVNTTPQD